MRYYKDAVSAEGVAFTMVLEGSSEEPVFEKLGYVPENRRTTMANGEANGSAKLAKPHGKSQLTNSEKEAFAAELVKHAKTIRPEVNMPTLRKVTSTMYRLIGKQIR